MGENASRWNAIVSALLALSTAVVGYLTLSGRLTTRRPAEEQAPVPSVVGDQNITARLWEDPLSAGREFARQNPASNSLPRPESVAEQIRIQQNKQSKVSILGVFVEGTPYPEDIEVRLRLRNAAQTALFREGFVPGDRNHLGLFAVEGWPASSELANRPSVIIESDRRDRRLLVPYEWYHRSAENGAGGNLSVLVLWLQEDEFADAPLTRLAFLLSRFARDADYTNAFCVVGPRSSDTLRAAIEERIPQQAYCYTNEPVCTLTNLANRLRLFSCQATAADPLIGARAGAVPRATVATSLDGKIRNSPGDAPAARGPKAFVNLIATDDQLMDLVVAELQLRGVDLRLPGESAAVVSEADTFYGRSLPTTLRAAVASARHKETDSRSTAEWMDSLRNAPGSIVATNVISFHYLRGLDGKTARRQQESDGAPKSSSKRLSSPEETLAALTRHDSESPQGEAQFDYVSRLTQQVAEQDRQLRRKGRNGIRTIGILGSDVYDKLILLQAFRKRFPEAVFFTTDLDARLWYQPELTGTRNLLVASAYDLVPPSVVDEDTWRVTAFRDNYQTALYEACRSALAAAGAPVSHSLTEPASPAIYEIGRNGPIRLTDPRPPSKVPGVPSPHSFFADPQERVSLPEGGKQIAGLISLALGVIGLHFVFLQSSARATTLLLLPRNLLAFCSGWWRRRTTLRQASAEANPPRNRSSLDALIIPEGEDLGQWRSDLTLWIVLFAFLVPLVGWLIAARLSRQPGQEPLRFLEGVSVWPTELLRGATLILVVAMLVWAWLKYRQHRWMMWRRYFSAEQGPSFHPISEAAAPAEAVNVPRPLWFLRRCFACRSSFGLWRQLPTAADALQVDAERVFAEYLWCGELRHRWIRLVPSAAAYLALGFGLMFATSGLPVAPIRGPTWFHLFDLILLIAVVAGFVCLVFYVVDAARLTERLLTRLAAGPTRWPAQAKAFAVLEHGGTAVDQWPDYTIEGWLDVRFAADQTREVGTLIYLPFVVLLLMLVSRNSYFDHWTWPLSLIALFVLSVLVAFICTLMIRRAARLVKQAALENLNKQMFATTAAIAGDDSEPDAPANSAAEVGAQVAASPRPSFKQYQALKNEIESVRAGAYGNFFQDPALVAFLIPSGGYGILVLIFRFLLGVE